MHEDLKVNESFYTKSIKDKLGTAALELIESWGGSDLQEVIIEKKKCAFFEIMNRVVLFEITVDPDSTGMKKEALHIDFMYKDDFEHLLTIDKVEDQHDAKLDSYRECARDNFGIMFLIKMKSLLETINSNTYIILSPPGSKRGRIYERHLQHLNNVYVA